MTKALNSRVLSEQILDLSTLQDDLEIIFDGSDVDESPLSKVKRKANREAIGRRYLQGFVPLIQSAQLLGPFDRKSGWVNPWRQKQASTGARSFRGIATRPAQVGAPVQAFKKASSKNAVLPSHVARDCSEVDEKALRNGHDIAHRNRRRSMSSRGSSLAAHETDTKFNEADGNRHTVHLEIDNEVGERKRKTVTDGEWLKGAHTAKRVRPSSRRQTTPTPAPRERSSFPIQQQNTLESTTPDQSRSPSPREQSALEERAEGVHLESSGFETSHDFTQVKSSGQPTPPSERKVSSRNPDLHLSEAHAGDCNKQLMASEQGERGGRLSTESAPSTPLENRNSSNSPSPRSFEYRRKRKIHSVASRLATLQNDSLMKSEEMSTLNARSEGRNPPESHSLLHLDESETVSFIRIGDIDHRSAKKISLENPNNSTNPNSGSCTDHGHLGDFAPEVIVSSVENGVTEDQALNPIFNASDVDNDDASVSDPFEDMLQEQVRSQLDTYAPPVSQPLDDHMSSSSCVSPELAEACNPARRNNLPFEDDNVKETNEDSEYTLNLQVVEKNGNPNDGCEYGNDPGYFVRQTSELEISLPPNLVSLGGNHSNPESQSTHPRPEQPSTSLMSPLRLSQNRERSPDTAEHVLSMVQCQSPWVRNECLEITTTNDASPTTQNFRCAVLNTRYSPSAEPQSESHLLHVTPPVDCQQIDLNSQIVGIKAESLVDIASLNPWADAGQKRKSQGPKKRVSWLQPAADLKSSSMTQDSPDTSLSLSKEMLSSPLDLEDSALKPSKDLERKVKWKSPPPFRPPFNGLNDENIAQNSPAIDAMAVAFMAADKYPCKNLPVGATTPSPSPQRTRKGSPWSVNDERRAKDTLYSDFSGASPSKSARNGIEAGHHDNNLLNEDELKAAIDDMGSFLEGWDVETELQKVDPQRSTITSSGNGRTDS